MDARCHVAWFPDDSDYAVFVKDALEDCTSGLIYDRDRIDAAIHRG